MPKQSQFLNQAFFALNNVLTTPPLLAALAVHGYDEKSIKAGLALHTQVETATALRDTAYGVVRRTNRSLQQSRDRLLDLFRGHVNVARVAFEREGYPDDMKITGPRSATTAEWLAHARKFYRYVPAELMVKYHVTKKELVEAEKMTNKVMELLALQQKTNSQAQQLTQDRTRSYRELRAWMKRFMGIARVVFAEQPQQLEALGTVVKA